MGPVKRLYEQVDALNFALHYLKEAERFNAAAASAGARRILVELKALRLHGRPRAKA